MLGIIGGVLVVVGTAVGALDNIINKKQEYPMEIYGVLENLDNIKRPLDTVPEVLFQRRKLMKAYEIMNGMIDTLDIFLESEQNEGDRENYEFVMEFLKDELQSKSSNIIKYIRNVSLEVEVLSQEEDRLERLRKQKEKKVNSLKKYLTDILLNLDKNKIETELGNLGLRKSVSVSIDNLDLIPKKYIQKKIELVPDKRMLSELLKQGKNIKGAHLENKYTLQIRQGLK